MLKKIVMTSIQILKTNSGTYLQKMYILLEHFNANQEHNFVL